jgi:hypothetical protein
LFLFHSTKCQTSPPPQRCFAYPITRRITAKIHQILPHCISTTKSTTVRKWWQQEYKCPLITKVDATKKADLIQKIRHNDWSVDKYLTSFGCPLSSCPISLLSSAIRARLLMVRHLSITQALHRAIDLKSITSTWFQTFSTSVHHFKTVNNFLNLSEILKNSYIISRISKLRLMIHTRSITSHYLPF